MSEQNNPEHNHWKGRGPGGRWLGIIAIMLGALALVVALGGRGGPQGWARGYSQMGPQTYSHQMGPQGFDPRQNQQNYNQAGPQQGFDPRQGPQGFDPRQGPQGFGGRHGFGPEQRFGPQQGWGNKRGPGGHFGGIWMIWKVIQTIARILFFGALLWIGAKLLQKRRAGRTDPPTPPTTGATTAL